MPIRFNLNGVFYEEDGLPPTTSVLVTFVSIRVKPVPRRAAQRVTVALVPSCWLVRTRAVMPFMKRWIHVYWCCRNLMVLTFELHFDCNNSTNVAFRVYVTGSRQILLRLVQLPQHELHIETKAANFLKRHWSDFLKPFWKLFENMLKTIWTLFENLLKIFCSALDIREGAMIGISAFYRKDIESRCWGKNWIVAILPFSFWARFIWIEKRFPTL